MKSVRKVVRQRRSKSSDLELAQALLHDLLEQVASDLEAIEAWHREGGQVPRSLTDPVAALPLIAEARKLVMAISKNQLTEAMTLNQVLEAFERFGQVVRLSVSGALRSKLPAAEAEEVEELILVECEGGWGSIECLPSAG